MLFFYGIFPIVLALILMTGFRMKPGWALPISWGCTVLAALFVWKMKFLEITAYSLAGIGKSLDIILIVFAAVFLLNILKKTGAAAVINSSFAAISPDRRIQTIIIALIFSSFIEGAAGFGSAPALVAPLLAGLGFPVVTACVVALVGNTLPVPFGAVGTPTITLNAILSENIASAGMEQKMFEKEFMTAFTDISFVRGVFWPVVMVALVIFLSGGKGKIKALAEIFVFCIFSGVAYFVPWTLTALYLGPELPSMVGAIGALIPVLIVTKLNIPYLIPRNVWLFPGETAEKRQAVSSPREVFKAWSPYLFIALLLVLTRLPMLPLKTWMSEQVFKIASFFGVPGTEVKWALLYNPGVFPICVITVGCIVWYRMECRSALQVFQGSLKQVLQAAIAIAASFAIVQIMIGSNTNLAGIPGMLNAIADTAARVFGKSYMIAAPFIGVLGTFFAGSCTVSNILFGAIQFNTAHLSGLPVEIVVALQNIGGGLGSMLRISGVVATCAAVNASGKEGQIILINCIPAAIMCGLALLVASLAM